MGNKFEILGENFTLNDLMQLNIGDKFQQAMLAFEKVQQQLCELSVKQNEKEEVAIKATTIMTFALLKKFSEGKKLTELGTSDWQDITKNVLQYGVFLEEQKYVQLVFGIYEDYIRYSAGKLESRVSGDIVAAISNLADELREKTLLFEENQIDEVKYIEDGLWISLEAMIKLIATVSYQFLGADCAGFTQALAAYAFEYGRLVLYKREQEIVKEFIQSQKQLDKELEIKYAMFIKDLQTQAEQFFVLIDNAFVPDFRQSFLNSIQLANVAGVSDKDILTSVEMIDDFFIG